MERAADSEPLDFPAAAAHYLPHQEIEATPSKSVRIWTSKVVVLQVCAGPAAVTAARTSEKCRAQAPPQGCKSETQGGLSRVHKPALQGL